MHDPNSDICFNPLCSVYLRINKERHEELLSVLEIWGITPQQVSSYQLLGNMPYFGSLIDNYLLCT